MTKPDVRDAAGARPKAGVIAWDIVIEVVTAIDPALPAGAVVAAWLDKSAAPGILNSLNPGKRFTHQVLDDLPPGKTVERLRSIPVAAGTLPARDEQMTRLDRWIGAAGQTRPAGQAELLDDYLPYAIVFGCTKQWADVTAALADADRAPSWYQAGEPFSPGTLSSLSRSGYYFSSMHHFATNTSNWIASHAASSGGSGSSGFSGGGFSGGGGGGSW